MKFDHGYRQQYVNEYLKKSKCYENVLTEDQLHILSTYMFKQTSDWRTSETGNLFFSGNFNTLVDNYVRPMLENTIPVSDIDWDKCVSASGNFFHTTHQYGVHTDMPELDNGYDDDRIAYRSILIPLYVLPSSTTHRIVFYDQRVVDSGCTLDHGPFKSTTHYRSFNNYSDIQHVYTCNGPAVIDPNREFTQEDFHVHGLNHAPSPIERYNGLTVEQSYQWQPGNIITFDTAQIHSSTRGNPKFKAKAGLRISLITKRNYSKYT